MSWETLDSMLGHPGPASVLIGAFLAATTLVGSAFGAWKAIHAVGLKRLTLSGMAIVGSSAIGWGISSLKHAPVAPSVAITAGIATIVVALIHAIYSVT